jgi:hypothetical protein
MRVHASSTRFKYQNSGSEAKHLTCNNGIPIHFFQMAHLVPAQSRCMVHGTKVEQLIHCDACVPASQTETHTHTIITFQWEIQINQIATCTRSRPDRAATRRTKREFTAFAEDVVAGKIESRLLLMSMFLETLLGTQRSILFFRIDIPQFIYDTPVMMWHRLHLQICYATYKCNGGY